MSELPQYRKNAYELMLESRIDVLEHRIDLLMHALGATFPTLSLEHVRNNNYVIADPPAHSLALDNTVSDQMIAKGRSPRFTARYNQARTDADRQNLIDELPQIDFESCFLPNMTGGYSWAHYPEGFSPNRIDYDETIWVPWVVRFLADDSVTSFEDWRASVISNPPHDQSPPPRVLKTASGSLCVALPDPDQPGYYLVAITGRHANQGQIIHSIEFIGSLRWMAIEGRWLELRGGLRESLYEAVDDWLQSIGFPPYLPPEQFELAASCVELVEACQSHFEKAVKRLKEDRNIDSVTVDSGDSWMLEFDPDYPGSASCRVYLRVLDPENMTKTLSRMWIATGTVFETELKATYYRIEGRDQTQGIPPCSIRMANDFIDLVKKIVETPALALRMTSHPRPTSD